MEKTLKKGKVVEKLNGKWFFSLDPDNNQNWHKEETEAPKTSIRVPGSWEEQGYGTASAHNPIGTWKKDVEYEGVAWYMNDIIIPESFEGLETNFILKGVRWHTELWIDGKFVGKGESLVAPHSFSITPYVQAGKKHRFVIKVDNTMTLALHESHIHSYHTATNWGGITGGIEIEGVLANTIDDIRIQANTLDKTIDLQVHLNHNQLEVMNRSLIVKIKNEKGHIITMEERDIDPSVLNVEFTLQMGENPKMWSPDHPYLHEIEISIYQNGHLYDVRKQSFGFRTFTTRENQFLLNDTPVFLTGYVDCCIFPQTGYPVWDKQYYKENFKIVKSYGFNHVRLHGWTAPEPFWLAADEEGILVQTELPHWSVFYRERGHDAPEEVHSFLKRELKRIIDNLHLHPSFVLLSMGNELTNEEGHLQLNQFVQYAREWDPTRLYTDNTGFGELPANDREGDFYIPTLNWHPPYHINEAAVPNTTTDFREVTRLEGKPLIAHEHGQFTMYVRPEEAQKYKGILKPSWLESIQETLQLKGLEHRVNEFIEATGVHMVRTLKEGMEKARRTPNLSGIQLLDIRDFPGQGHATVGILDVFWNSKGVIKPESFRQFNSQTVLLMRSSKRTYFTGETLKATLEVSHFGKPMKNVNLKWTITAKDRLLQQGAQLIDNLKSGGNTEISLIQMIIPDGEATKLQLYAEIEIDGEVVKNQWDFWSMCRVNLPVNQPRIWSNVQSLRSIMYGAKFEKLIGIKQHSHVKVEGIDLAVTNRLSRDVLQYLIDGGSVWLMAQPNEAYDEVATKYLPIFWNYLWFSEQAGTTMGMIIHKHPSLKYFPHDRFTDWQWYHIVNNAVALNLDSLPNVKPIVEVIDNFNRAKRLAYAFEAKVGKGKLFVSTFNFLEKNMMKQPEVHTLYLELLNYLNSDEFNPSSCIKVGELLGMFKLRSLY
ncbi:glycoside hydrolase family 2 protein [Metabacillus niabensis]|uniref:glycoside hydrolase family 2 protein n=1 Tax=Metabacillus niabensis TaxID=324854 RepID=UPI00399F8913